VISRVKKDKEWRADKKFFQYMSLGNVLAAF